MIFSQATQLWQTVSEARSFKLSMMTAAVELYLFIPVWMNSPKFEVTVGLAG